MRSYVIAPAQRCVPAALAGGGPARIARSP